MAEGKAVTRQIAARYEGGSKKLKSQILDELSALTGWSRDHARKALREARRPVARCKRPERPRPYHPALPEVPFAG